MRKSEKTEPDHPKQKTEWKFDAKLPSGQRVRVKIKQGTETVERKVKVEAGVRLIGRDDQIPIPVYSNMRNKKGELVTQPMKVMGLRITVRFDGGKELEARSCCKPPDVFNAKTARRRALHRLFMLDSGIDPANVQWEESESGRRMRREDGHEPRLNGEDRKSLFYLVMRNGKEKIKKTAEQPETPGNSLAVG